MRISDIISPTINESGHGVASFTKEIEDVLPTAVNDFISDWLEVDNEDREPEPRRGFMTAMRSQGFDPHRDFANPEFERALATCLRAEAERFLSNLPWQGSQLPIFRAIAVKPGWEIDPEATNATFGGLGVYWGISDKFNFIMVRDGQSLYEITSAVRFEQVDWWITILKHLTYSEDEIRVKDDQRVPILGISVCRGAEKTPLNVSRLRGKLFSVGTKNEEWGD